MYPPFKPSVIFLFTTFPDFKAFRISPRSSGWTTSPSHSPHFLAQCPPATLSVSVPLTLLDLGFCLCSFSVGTLLFVLPFTHFYSSLKDQFWHPFFRKASFVDDMLCVSLFTVIVTLYATCLSAPLSLPKKYYKRTEKLIFQNQKMKLEALKWFSALFY